MPLDDKNRHPRSPEQQPLEVDQIFPNFTWQEGMKPKALNLNQAGFFENPDGYWYLIRRARSVSGFEAGAADLFHGSKPQYKNATQGTGLYFTNYPEAAIRVLYVGRGAKLPRELYVGRVLPTQTEILDATSSVRGHSLAHQAAILALRAMSTSPLMFWPTPGMYDRLYGPDIGLVLSKPSAIQRLPRPKLDLGNGNKIVIPRYAVVRDPQLVEIVAHKHLD